MNAIDLRGVTKSYGRTQALAGVDLAFDRGVTGLLGPNGAGKTTLLRIVATSIAADGGKVQLLGRDPHGSQSDVTGIRRELGYLPQELGYPSDMTAFGFVEYVAVLKEWNDRRRRAREVRRVLDLVGLSDLAAKKVSKLSGGQRRRVVLGCDAVLELHLHRPAINVGDVALVLEDHVVEAGSFEVLCHLDVELAVPRHAAGSPRSIPLIGHPVAEPREVKSIGSHVPSIHRQHRCRRCPRLNRARVSDVETG